MSIRGVPAELDPGEDAPGTDEQRHRHQGRLREAPEQRHGCWRSRSRLHRSGSREPSQNAPHSTCSVSAGAVSQRGGAVAAWPVSANEIATASAAAAVAAAGQPRAESDAGRPTAATAVAAARVVDIASAHGRMPASAPTGSPPSSRPARPRRRPSTAKPAKASRVASLNRRCGHRLGRPHRQDEQAEAHGAQRRQIEQQARRRRRPRPTSSAHRRLVSAPGAPRPPQSARWPPPHGRRAR